MRTKCGTTKACRVRAITRAIAILSLSATVLQGGDLEGLQKALAKIDPEIEPSHYEVTWADLDRDGSEDGLVLMNGTSGYAGSGGSTLFLFRSAKDSFEALGRIKTVRPPIYLRASSHHGWADLLVRVSGGGAAPHFAALSHDGKSYPPGPGEDAVEVAPDDKVLIDDPIPADGHEKEAEPVPEGRPAQLEPSALAGWEALSQSRRELLEFAVGLGRERHFDAYVFGSADPERGGFDCSGAMFCVLKSRGLEPPRTSSGQYEWIEKAGNLVMVPPETRALEDEVFSKLQPGDLLFWAGTYDPTDGRKNHITHVQMYLGKEKKDGRPVMIGSTDGRSYRGRRQCGYGVFDFRLPQEGSKSHFAGYGSPPGIE